MARYDVHRLIQNLFKEPGLLERLVTAPDAVYDAYGLDDAERKAVSDASPPALAAIGVHPILQMHLMLARNPQMAELISVKAYASNQENA
jgi:2'-aminobiphenyl-2,3-diol 1,2-dioxygenase, small subunit